MRLAAGVVAESLIATVLPAVGPRPRQRDDAAAELAPGDVAGGGHKPPHLQVHRTHEAVEVPGRVDSGKVWPPAAFERETYAIPAYAVNDFFDRLHGAQ